MRKIVRFVSNFTSFRHLSEVATPSGVNKIEQEDFFPTKQFLHRYVRRPSQKERFIQIASELKIYTELYENDGKFVKFDDEMWRVLMNMLNWEERCKFLIELRKSLKENTDKDVQKDQKRVSEINMEKLRNGEMVYARDFHALVDIYGQDFRRKIDAMYGINYLNNQEDSRNLIVDCRFLREFSVTSQVRFLREMQSLHDENWISRRPLKIHFANYQPDEQLAVMAKKNLLFRYGPSSNTYPNFVPHPFSPNVTARRIAQIVKPENVMYISSKATRFLPDIIPDNISGIVVCLSHDSSPATSSTTACISDKIHPYRVPFRKYLSSSPTRIQLSQYLRIFRDYFEGTTIQKSIISNMRQEKERKNERSGEVLEKQFRSAMHHINNCSLQSNHIT